MGCEPVRSRRPSRGWRVGAAIATRIFLAWFFAIPLAFPADTVLPQFTDVAGKSGLRFRHNFGAKKLENVLMTTGSGCALFDYDNDGWLDAFLLNGTYIDKDARPLPDKVSGHALFHNRGDGTFENVTRAAGLGEPSYGQGCACGDFDGDGLTDLYHELRTEPPLPKPGRWHIRGCHGTFWCWRPALEHWCGLL